MPRAAVKRIPLAACLIAALLAAVPAGAQTSAMKDLLGNLWARLRAATPRANPVVATTTVTAGLRGAEATESELKPYWKSDREQDPASLAERQALDNAQSLADAGNYAEAAARVRRIRAGQSAQPARAQRAVRRRARPRRARRPRAGRQAPWRLSSSRIRSTRSPRTPSRRWPRCADRSAAWPRALALRRETR